MPRRKSLVFPRWMASGKTGNKAFVNTEKAGSVYMLEFRPPCNTDIPRGHMALLFDFAGASELDGLGAMTSVNGTLAQLVVSDVDTRKTCLIIRHVSSSEEPFYISPTSISRYYFVGRLMRFPLDSPSDWCESVLPVLASVYRQLIESEEELGEGEFSVLFENEEVMVDFVMPTETEVRTTLLGVFPDDSHGPWWDNSLNCITWCKQVVKAYTELTWPNEGLCAAIIWPNKDLDLFMSQGKEAISSSPRKESSQSEGAVGSKAAADASVEAEQSHKSLKRNRKSTGDLYTHSETPRALKDFAPKDASKSIGYTEERIDEWSLQWQCCEKASTEPSSAEISPKGLDSSSSSSNEGSSLGKLFRKFKKKLGGA